MAFCCKINLHSCLHLSEKMSIREYFSAVKLTTNDNVKSQVGRPASIIPNVLEKTADTKAQINRLCRQIKSWYFELKQQLCVEFAHKSTPWLWVLEATRRAWPTCVRFMTRKSMLEKCGWTEPFQMAKTIFNSYTVTREQICYYASKVKQRSPEWHQVREGFALPKYGIYRGCLVSSSTAGEWCGNKLLYKSDDGMRVHSEVLHGKKFDENAKTAIMTQHGTAMEPLIMAQAILAVWMLIYFICGEWGAFVHATEVGLEIYYDEPFVGVSSDGRVKIVLPKQKKSLQFGLEMKCIGDVWGEPYKAIKPEYFCQVQLTMFVQRLRHYLFTCHAARGFSLEIYKYQRDWWESQMQIIRRRYWGAYWPSFVMKTHGLLKGTDLLPSFTHYGDFSSNYLCEQYGVGRVVVQPEAELMPAKKPIYSVTTSIATMDEDIDYAAIDL